MIFNSPNLPSMAALRSCSGVHFLHDCGFWTWVWFWIRGVREDPSRPQHKIRDAAKNEHLLFFEQEPPCDPVGQRSRNGTNFLPESGFHIPRGLVRKISWGVCCDTSKIWRIVFRFGQPSVWMASRKRPRIVLWNHPIGQADQIQVTS